MSAAKSSVRCSDPAGYEEDIMSRVGKYPGSRSPTASTVDSPARILTAKGKLGELTVACTDDVTVEMKDGRSGVNPTDEQKRARAMWGTARALVNNIVNGVSEGFTRRARDQRRRLSRRSPGQEPEAAARLQPRRPLSDPRGHHDQAASGRPRSSRSAAPTASRSARSRPRSARSAARALQGQGHQVPATRRSAARKARRSKAPMAN